MSRRVPLLALAGSSIAYCLLVIWYVATFPDIGVRCLLPANSDEHQLEVTQFVFPEADCLAQGVKPGDLLQAVNRKPANNFFRLMSVLADLRNAPIPPGGQLNPGYDPSEPPRSEVQALVEVAGGEGQRATRYVELRIQKPAAPDLPIHTYVTVKPPRSSDFLLTISWFVCQLVILLVALAVWWQRPSDTVVRLFCVMCSVAMPAFVGGFHWWILVANPLLNLPFIFAACLLPAATLHFFTSFPRQNALFRSKPMLLNALTYGPPVLGASVIAFVYWAAYVLAGPGMGDGELSTFQKLTAIAGNVLQGQPAEFAGTEVCAVLLYLLRLFVFCAIAVSAVYFGLTVISLSISLFRTQNPVERKQASSILVASLIATIPIGYTLYLAFFQQVDFALGRARIPMFIASALFMVAYAHGMLKHRLVLSDEVLKRGRRYSLMTGIVTGGCAVLLSAGAVLTRTYGLPQQSTWLLQLALFLVLVIAIGFILWARDRIQDTVDQRFFADNYQLDRTLKRLNSASGYLSDPTSLAEITLASCRDVLDCGAALMYVREATGNMRLIGADSVNLAPASLSGEIFAGAHDEQVIRRIPSLSRSNMSPIQKLLHEIPAELTCLLLSETGVDGVIILGAREDGLPYSTEDLAFLQAMGQMTVLALHSSRANQDLARLDSELKAKVDYIAEQQRQLSILRAELTSLHDVDETDPGLGPDEFSRGEIRGNCTAIRDVLETSRKAASSDATVLVRGESGTGKELMARIVHRNSDRRDQPLVSVNCAALAPSLLESELFGHVKGAFTGASSDKAGRFQAADGGTLFLDEIGDISQETQVKLLRVLQERCFEPVGTTESVKIDVRLIAATNRDLEAMIASGEFREDLYYRLNVISLTLPPLRERRDDMIELVFFFLNRAVRKTNKRISHIEPEALRAIEGHHWPGNIRELENAIERAVVLAEGDTISIDDLPPEVGRSTIPVLTETKAVTAVSSNWRSSDSNTFAPPASKGDTPRDTSQSARQRYAEQEKQRIREAIEEANGNKAQAARALNMPRSTFYSKLRKYGLTE